MANPSSPLPPVSVDDQWREVKGTAHRFPAGMQYWCLCGKHPPSRAGKLATSAPEDERLRSPALMKRASVPYCQDCLDIDAERWLHAYPREGAQ